MLPVSDRLGKGAVPVCCPTAGKVRASITWDMIPVADSDSNGAAAGCVEPGGGMSAKVMSIEAIDVSASACTVAPAMPLDDTCVAMPLVTIASEPTRLPAETMPSDSLKSGSDALTEYAL